MKRPHVAWPAALAVLLAGCGGDRFESPAEVLEQPAQPIDRLLMGQAAKYPADLTLRAKAPALAANMAERRKMAWSIVERVVSPATIVARAAKSPRSNRLALPRFQTWYSRDDLSPMFDRLFRALPPADQVHHERFTEGAIAATFPWNARVATTLASYTDERRASRLRELATPEGLHSLGKDPRVLMSPAYVAHVLRSYPEIVGCTPPPADQTPVSETNFAPCLVGEFPEGAAAVKMRWVRGDGPMPTYDTSPAGLAAKFAAEQFGDGDGMANPDANAIYTMNLTPTDPMRLAALHIMTKELRDWAWVTLWWSSDPHSDFGADRPASLSALGGPWANYKMCVVTAFEELDPTARLGEDDLGSWCSNPYLEQGPRAVKTSCIGCHQHGGTDETSATILSLPPRFPQGSRAKTRQNFPADYAFTTQGGLDLAADFRTRIEALLPPPEH